VSELLDPRLRDCRKLFMRDLRTDISIGFHAFEREAHQPVLINIDLYVLLAHSTSGSDDVRDVLDYDEIRAKAIALAHSRHFNLQETLLDLLVAMSLSYPGVRAVRASIEKPNVYPDCRTVGIEVFRVHP